MAFLECDIGQTEFTPSSFVSLTFVTEPLLGPPFTHHVWPNAAVFYGETSPEKDARGYLDCLKEVYKAYQNLPTEVPLIVNTMGWNKGLGLELFVDILRMTRPTHIVQLDHPSKPRNFPLMTPDFVDSMDGFASIAGQKSYHDVIYIPSLVDLKTEWSGKFMPKDYRNFIFYSYFGHNFSLTEAVPYEVPWSHISVHVKNPTAAPAQILNILNGSVVSLCTVSKSKLPPKAHNAPRLISGDKSFTPLSKGLGIIRSVDPVRKVFHVITPVAEEHLFSVNCFVLGALTLPEQLITSQKLVESLPGTIPWFGEYKDSLGSSAVARKRHMMRGKRQWKSTLYSKRQWKCEVKCVEESVSEWNLFLLGIIHDVFWWMRILQKKLFILIVWMCYFVQYTDYTG